MDSNCSSQIVAYIAPELRKQLEADRMRLGHRVSISAYVESVLRRHLEKKRRVAA